eukprot:CAMPEP_0119077940 /NCGR_PEP_ID=MMETSP1178-20130426/97327_1 /TAXON_ID=33656 /ORGANISM="unid sp, Strain CCMP2000" /LENGTH=45 /DNA_ID= /DNA_START= /DNA_END= /DNA_ORIENTATION=
MALARGRKAPPVSLHVLAFLCVSVAAARRRQLFEHDLHYGLDGWN